MYLHVFFVCENSTALLIGVVLSSVAAIVAAKSDSCAGSITESTQSTRIGGKRKQNVKKSIQIATKIRRETIQMTKTMDGSALTTMIGRVLQLSLRKYPHTLEFFNFTLGSTANDRLKKLKNFGGQNVKTFFKHFSNVSKIKYSSAQWRWGKNRT